MKRDKDREEDAKWHVFDQTVRQAREAFASLPANKLHDTIDKAIVNVRKRERLRIGRRSGA
jgi:hypothetical protein